MNHFEEIDGGSYDEERMLGIFCKCHPEKLNPTEGELWEVSWLNIELQGAEHRYRPEYDYAFLIRSVTTWDRSMAGLWACYRIGDRKRTKMGKLLKRRFRHFRLSRRAPCECCRVGIGLPPIGSLLIREEEG